MSSDKLIQMHKEIVSSIKADVAKFANDLCDQAFDKVSVDFSSLYPMGAVLEKRNLVESMSLDLPDIDGGYLSDERVILNLVDTSCGDEYHYITTNYGRTLEGRYKNLVSKFGPQNIGFTQMLPPGRQLPADVIDYLRAVGSVESYGADAAIAEIIGLYNNKYAAEREKLAADRVAFDEIVINENERLRLERAGITAEHTRLRAEWTKIAVARAENVEQANQNVIESNNLKSERQKLTAQVETARRDAKARQEIKKLNVNLEIAKWELREARRRLDDAKREYENMSELTQID